MAKGGQVVAMFIKPLPPNRIDKTENRTPFVGLILGDGGGGLFDYSTLMRVVRFIHSTRLHCISPGRHQKINIKRSAFAALRRMSSTTQIGDLLSYSFP